MKKLATKKAEEKDQQLRRLAQRVIGAPWGTYLRPHAALRAALRAIKRRLGSQAEEGTARFTAPAPAPHRAPGVAFPAFRSLRLSRAFPGIAFLGYR
jgi:hypothetical protein